MKSGCLYGLLGHVWQLLLPLGVYVRQARKPCACAELWSLNRCSDSVELGPRSSTYLTVVILAPLMSGMATTIVLMFVGLTAMIIVHIATTGSTGKIWHFGFDLGFIVGIRGKVRVDACVCYKSHPGWLFFGPSKGHVISRVFIGPTDLWCQAEITEKQVTPYIICCL